MAHENLYGSLGYNIPTEDLSLDEKHWLTRAIEDLDIEKKKVIYHLMLHDYTKANPSTKVIFPYKSKQVSNDRLEIKLDAMPIRLKRIIYKFVKLAEISATEDDTKTPLATPAPDC